MSVKSRVLIKMSVSMMSECSGLNCRKPSFMDVLEGINWSSDPLCVPHFPQMNIKLLSIPLIEFPSLP